VRVRCTAFDCDRSRLGAVRRRHRGVNPASLESGRVARVMRPKVSTFSLLSVEAVPINPPPGGALRQASRKHRFHARQR
jgi:hypothetical protein